MLLPPEGSVGLSGQTTINQGKAHVDISLSRGKTILHPSKAIISNINAITHAALRGWEECLIWMWAETQHQSKKLCCAVMDAGVFMGGWATVRHYCLPVSSDLIPTARQCVYTGTVTKAKWQPDCVSCIPRACLLITQSQSLQSRAFNKSLHSEWQMGLGVCLRARNTRINAHIHPPQRHSTPVNKQSLVTVGYLS